MYMIQCEGNLVFHPFMRIYLSFEVIFMVEL